MKTLGVLNILAVAVACSASSDVDEHGIQATSQVRGSRNPARENHLVIVL